LRAKVFPMLPAPKMPIFKFFVLLMKNCPSYSVA
jgi:hypothetical protein